MALNTPANMDEGTVEKLQDLIQINIDSYNGFIEAAEKIDHENLAGLFRELATDRSGFAEELKQFVRMNEESPEQSGSGSAKAHRLWIDLRAALNGGDPYVILIEAERGEDKIKSKYEDALKDTAGSPVNDVLQRQYARVKAGHDRVRDLRDAQKE